MSAFEIRAANPDDSGPVADYHDRCFRKTYSSQLLAGEFGVPDVEPDHQGVGIGRQLLAQGEAMIAASGHTNFELHTRVENLPAIAFYQAAGWTVTDRLIRTVEHGISYDERVLIKRRR